MASRKVTVKGKGPELFGRGVDLLFGDANGAAAAQAAPADQPREAAYLGVNDTAAEAPVTADDYLSQAAADFFQSQGTLDSPAGPNASPPAPQASLSLEDDGSPNVAAAGVADQPAVADWPAGAVQAGLPPLQSLPPNPPAQPVQEHNEGDIMPEQHPSTQVEEAELAQPAASSSIRKVGAPAANGQGQGDPSMLPENISTAPGTVLTKQEAREILSKLPRSDLRSLDKEVDALYEQVSILLSGSRQEATIAFDILRRARLILLKDPEQFADAEYLVRQVRARMNQIEQSLAGARVYALRIFAYQTVWMAVLALLALVTTVGGTTFSAWTAYLLGIPLESERLNWAVLFISTLAWGGIGGVTSALWSLYHHVSVLRDYDPVENLWYYSQPVLGMVLGGVVFLVIGSGFLVVQVDLAAQDAALGARLLPAAVAVVAGFRQTMFLDLVERIIALIMPGKPEEQPGLQATVQQPPQEPAI